MYNGNILMENIKSTFKTFILLNLIKHNSSNKRLIVKVYDAFNSLFSSSSTHTGHEY